MYQNFCSLRSFGRPCKTTPIAFLNYVYWIKYFLHTIWCSKIQFLELWDYHNNRFSDFICTQRRRTIAHRQLKKTRQPSHDKNGAWIQVVVGSRRAKTQQLLELRRQLHNKHNTKLLHKAIEMKSIVCILIVLLDHVIGFQFPTTPKTPKVSLRNFPASLGKRHWFWEKSHIYSVSY